MDRAEHHASGGDVVVDSGEDRFAALLVRLVAESDLFEAEVLSRLNVKDHFALAGVSRACRRALAESEGMKWVRARGEIWSRTSRSDRSQVKHDACKWAAGEGNLEVLQWLRARGCEWDWETCARAAEGGHLEVLQWARANGCEWDPWTCGSAARGGHLDVLKWLRENGCEWDEETCAGAAEGGHLEVLRWARENGCPDPESSDDNDSSSAWSYDGLTDHEDYEGDEDDEGEEDDEGDEE